MTTLRLTKKYKTYPEYKDSGVEWIGKSPSSWDLAKFKAVFSGSNERVSDSPEVDLPLSVSGYRGVEPRDVTSGDGQMPSDSIATYRVVHPDQLVVNTMWLNYCGLGVSKLTGYVSPAYRAYDIRDELVPAYAHYLMRSTPYVQKYSSLLYGIRPNSLQVKPKDFENIEILLPSAKEQEKIAAFLDEKTALIDAIIEKKQKLVELLKEKRAAVINHTVTKGLDPDAPLIDSGVAWIGKIPKGWKVKKLKHGIKSVESGVWGEDPKGDEDDVCCLRVADFDYENFSYSSIETVRHNPGLSIKKILEDGDILIEKSGGGEKTPVGRAILFNDGGKKATCANFVDIVRLDKEVYVPRFVVLALSALYASGINTLYIKQNTGIQNLNIKAYLAELVPTPSIDEQERIADSVFEELARFAKAQSQISKTIESLQEFKASLVSQTVTGNIKI